MVYPHPNETIVENIPRRTRLITNLSNHSLGSQTGTFLSICSSSYITRSYKFRNIFH